MVTRWPPTLLIQGSGEKHANSASTRLARSFFLEGFGESSKLLAHPSQAGYAGVRVRHEVA